MLKWTLLSLGVLGVCIGLLVKDHVRTLYSLRKIPGTKAYVMDYYVNYNIGEVRSKGIDVQHVENSVIATLLPAWTHSMAMRLKSKFMPQRIEALDNGHHCSTLMVHPHEGDVFFGRNFDFLHDACLILKVHKEDKVTSVAVLDLRFLNLNRGDLETTSLIRRIPLLFAPYYLQDGMNQHGVAVADMSVHGVKPPHDPTKPNIIHSLAMRLILDYAQTSDEAIELLRQYNVYFVAVTCHLLVADASGKSVVVEFIDGEMKTTPANENWQVCTNHEICGKSEAENDAACERYRKASNTLAAMGSTVSTSDVMNVMESVKQPSTMWTSVYNLSTGDFSIAYRRQYDNPFADDLERLKP
jgi:hypothetical protein